MTPPEPVKAFAVEPSAGKPTIYVRTGNDVETLVFKSKKAADKKILSLIAGGYEFDATHEKIRPA